MCTPVALELLFSTRNAAEHDRLLADLSLLPNLAIDRNVERMAVATQSALARKSQHRGASPVDLLIAAVAEANDALLLHYDRHFDSIGRVTGQAMEWLARRGSLD
jgi:predicted nucleic acid-binding protein